MTTRLWVNGKSFDSMDEEAVREKQNKHCFKKRTEEMV